MVELNLVSQYLSISLNLYFIRNRCLLSSQGERLKAQDWESPSVQFLVTTLWQMPWRPQGYAQTGHREGAGLLFLSKLALKKTTQHLMTTSLVPSEGSTHNDLITLFRPCSECLHHFNVTTLVIRLPVHGLGRTHPNHIQIIAHLERDIDKDSTDLIEAAAGGLCERTNVSVLTDM